MDWATSYYNIRDGPLQQESINYTHKIAFISIQQDLICQKKYNQNEGEEKKSVCRSMSLQKIIKGTNESTYTCITD